MKNRLFNMLSALLDAIILFGSYLLVTLFRFDYTYGADFGLKTVWSKTYLFAALLYTFLTITLFWMNKLYEADAYKKLYQKILRVVIVNAMMVLITTAFLYFTRIADFSRVTLLLFFAISTILISIKYSIMRGLSHIYLNDARNIKRVVIVGMNKQAIKYAEEICCNKAYATSIEGYVALSSNQKINTNISCLGDLSDLNNVLVSTNPDIVVIDLNIEEMQYLKDAVKTCEKYGIKIKMIPYYNDYIQTNARIETIGNIKLINVRAIPLDDLANMSIKRFFDIVLSILFIFIALPVILLTIIGIKITMPGKLLFYQERIGLNKRVFKMYKFRSMRENEQSEIAWSTNDDDRRTPFGRFIRKLSIDELPQLFNVLKGDMSIVGPRPEIPFYVNRFIDEVPLYMLRSQVRPGMTGWAQIHNLRGDTSIRKRVEYDLYYIENWSLGLDMVIILKTIFGGFLNNETIVSKKKSNE